MKTEKLDLVKKASVVISAPAVPVKTKSSTPLTKEKESKPYQAFRDSIDWFDLHMQLVDAAIITATKALRDKAKFNVSVGDVLVVGQEASYPDLYKQPVKSYSKVISQSQNREIEFAICRLYRFFNDYLKAIVKEVVVNKPTSVAQSLINASNPSQNITFRDLVQFSDISDIKQYITDTIFRSLESDKSTPALIDKIVKSGNLNIKEDLKKDALQYLELRHLYIHNKGKIDKKYAVKYGNACGNDGDKICSSFALYTKAKEAIVKLCEAIDKEAIAKKMIVSR